MKNKNIQLYDIAIIGAGASGMMAALSAAKCGARVVVLEHMDRIGKKLLATGNGKCNFTNADMALSYFNGKKELISSIYEQFPIEQTLSFFHEIGICPKEKNGYYYPNSEQAASVVEAFRFALVEQGITIVTGITVSDITYSKKGFTLQTAEDTFITRRLIWAVGGLAAPKLGSDGSAFSFIKAFGHRFAPMVPALCGFYCEGLPFKKISGVRTLAKIDLYVGGELAGSDTGELQFTDYGISGIPVFQISRHASIALTSRKSCTATINFLPNFTKEQLLEELSYRIQRFPTATAHYLLNGLLNAKLIDVLMQISSIPKDKSLHMFSKQEIMNLCNAIFSCKVKLTKSRDFEFAQVCAGGIRTEEIDPSTLESRLIPGMYFCGELLDVDGICGGYNLQWAWSSGFVAGTNAAGK